LAQTPQGFRRTETRAFFEVTGPLTDDVQALERAGRPVEIVRGSADNFKVTLPEDFDLCRRILAARKDR
jgi:2-C-methyl-D-erythritol 4-phosphate cytidylyltransferase